MLFTTCTFFTSQADHKLSYALRHCNPQSEANIRFGSGVLAAYILHLDDRLDCCCAYIFFGLNHLFICMMLILEFDFDNWPNCSSCIYHDKIDG